MSSAPSPMSAGAKPQDIPWKPLDRAKRQIRVIQLLDTSEPTLHCTLHTVSLDDWTPEYLDHLPHFPNGSVAERTEAWTRSAFYDVSSDGGSDMISFPRWRFDITGLEPSQLPVQNFKLLSELVAARDSQTDNNSPATSKSGPFAQKTFNIRPRFRWGDFEAISYCWGSASGDSMIDVNGTLVPIPKSLDGALRQVQKLPDAGSFYFWADALSIAQDDLDEKNDQVGMMREIFSSALAVITCLGPGIGHHNGTVDRIVEYGYILATRPTPMVPDGLSAPHDSNSWPYQELNWPGTISILSSQYWQRLWIIQELALNHNMTLFMCEDGNVSRPMLQRVAEVGRDIPVQVITAFEAQSPPSSQATVKSAQMVFAMAEQVDALLRLGHKPVANLPRERMHGTESTDPEQKPCSLQSLSTILDLAHKASCYNLRDKVFGLTGILSKHHGIVIEPDYAAPVERVYTEFARVLLRARGAEEILAWCSPRATSSNLPSWVPDWRVRFPRNYVGSLRKKRACATRTAVSTAVGPTLRCRGLIVDSLTGVSTSAPQSLPHAKNRGMSVQPADSQQTPKSTGNRYGAKAAISLALSQTLTMDHSSAIYQRTRWRALRDENENTLVGNIFWIQQHEDPSTTTSPSSSSSDSLGSEPPPSWDSVCAYRPLWGRIWDREMNITNPTQYWLTFQRWRQTNANFPLFGSTRLRDYFHSIHLDDLPSTVPPTLATHRDSYMLTQEDGLNMALAVLSLKERKLATTATGWMALVPEDAATGDVLAVLYSVNFPVVLRPCGEAFEYVGECYVHGIMDGEAVEMLERGELVERDIVLC